MYLRDALILLCVFTSIASIRVPASWTTSSATTKQKRIRTTTTAATTPQLLIRSSGSENAFQARPYGRINNSNKINSGRKKSGYVRHPNPKNWNNNDWTPIIAPHLRNPKKYHPIASKNYRDDKTHEPTVQDASLDIPTRPIYPGEGKWAKKGRKYRLFISPHKFTPLSDDNNEEKPEGVEVFEENKQFFEGLNDKFQDNFKSFPQTHNLGSYIDDDKSDSSSEEDSEEREFVPTRLYAQVRRSENEEHLPKNEEDERLKESIKDSKIQTVYTEEGYEDSAYDHAGHEKNAEQDEGFSEFDKEIEADKEKKRPIKNGENQDDDDDSEPAGSQYSEKPRSEKIKMTKDNFIKTEETKTTQVKDKDGNSEMEISSEIKVLATPNNGTKTHKFVKIYPKVSKIKDTKESSNSTNQDLTPEASALKYISKSFYKMEHKKRFKRFANDIPKIEVDTDFIDKINTNLPVAQPQPKTKPKYPYYQDSSINPDSPLRYSEDYSNIPPKSQDDLAFYNQADKVECAEVEDGIDPIPKRVKDAEQKAEDMEEAKDIEELVQGPRLGNLGDKIDCFKQKYFGDNPLDSPIFEEQTIGPVNPIFNLFKKENLANIKEEFEEVQSTTPIIIEETTVDSKQINTTSKLDVASNIIESEVSTTPQSTDITNQTETATISIITTPKYTIDKTPKHIYDQIELLQYLPSTLNITVEESSRSSRNLDLESTSTPSISSTNSTSDDTPKSEALMILTKKKRRRRIRPRRRPLYHIFDVNRFLPKNPYYNDKSTHYNNIIRGITDSDDINTKDQLNVFSDVINNIKNSTIRDSETGDSNNVDTISVKLNSLNYNAPKIKIPHRAVHIKNNDEAVFYVSTTSTMRPLIATVPRKFNKNNAHRNNEHLYEDLVSNNNDEDNGDEEQYENLEIFKIGVKAPITTRKTTTTTTTTTQKYTIADNLEAQSEDSDAIIEKPVVEVFGLMPPGVDRYKTIYNPKIKMNNFYVLGMKPPSLKQKVYLYSDFKKHPHNIRRYKRSAQRPSYSEFRRNPTKPIDVEVEDVKIAEEDDDYIPHRPKNYHYDEETGRIVYDKKPETVQEAEEEDVEYIEVTDAPIPKPTRKMKITTPKFIEFTGPSYVDYIKQLKSNPKYQAIPDPTTTEKSLEAIETSTSTTLKPVSTNPPEFLSILAKVRGDSSYKMIADPDDDKKKKKTTTVAPIEEDDEEESEENRNDNVQNSPGGQSSSGLNNFQIFDINEYLPKIKNYTPRTSIDYSKYKTIERPLMRHNLSSRYSSEEDLDDVKTVRVPILMKVEENRDSVMMSESKFEEVEPEATTTTTTTITPTTTRRTRTRTRTRPSTSSSGSTENTTIVAHNDKPKRTYPRRQRTRIKLNRPSTRSSTTIAPDEDSTKIVRRRHYIVTPEDVATNTTSKPGSIEPRDLSLRARILKRRHEMKSEDKNEEESQDKVVEQNRNAKKIEDVQVFQKYDKSKKHGGNLKKESEIEESRKVQRLTDVVPKPFAFYSDPKLPKSVNQLMEDAAKTDVEILEDEEEISEAEEEASYDYDEAEKISTTKKPVYVKDPGKRLYYYAPI